MPDVDFSKYNFSGMRAVADANGNTIADIMDSKAGDAILIEPRSGANIRKVAELAAALVTEMPDKKIGYDFSANYYPVSAGDTATEIIIRHLDASSSPAGRYLKPGRQGNDFFEAEIVAGREANIKLFDVVIDAIRLSRANGDKAVEFKFNKYLMTVNAKDDAEEIERLVPAGDRLTNIPPPQPSKPLARDPDTKAGGFTIRGNIKPSY